MAAAPLVPGPMCQAFLGIVLRSAKLQNWHPWLAIRRHISSSVLDFSGEGSVGQCKRLDASQMSSAARDVTPAAKGEDSVT
jgi:hypothetical protein